MLSSSLTLSRRRVLLAGLATYLLPFIGRTHAAATQMMLTQVAPGIYMRRGLDADAAPQNDNAIANIGFAVGTTAVAIIDPGGCLADGERLRTAVRATSTLPIRYVIMSHAHPDHIFGAGAFIADQPTFIGHYRLPEALARRGTYYQHGLDSILGPERAGPVVPPTTLVHDNLELDLGGRILVLTAHGVAHTDSDLSIFDPQTRTLLPADLLFVERIPSLDGSLRGWLKELGTLKTVDAHYAVPGHGPIKVRWPDAAIDEERYFGVLLRETRQAVSRGVGIDKAVATVGRSERERWKLFDDYNGHNVTQAYKELEWE
ncbi:MAG: quinoprotein relay system zinc metallohydrolase 2 [Rhodospirillales bacterium]|nr:quinoprotein relay system zinc metallohydrolase 2 [Rhodospirillales bacterium]